MKTELLYLAVVFAALVLAAVAAGVSNPVIVGACVVYFWARVVHVLAYTFAVPWVRTLWVRRLSRLGVRQPRSYGGLIAWLD